MLRRGRVLIATVTAMGITFAAPLMASGITLPWPATVNEGEKALPDKELRRVTADGWQLHVKKVEERLHIASPLDGAVTTGEVFGSLNASAWIDGDGFPQLTGAVFEAGYQIGCGVDVSSGADVSVSGNFGVAPHASLGVEGGPDGRVGVEGGPSVGTGVEAGPSVKVSIPDGTGTLGADAKAKAKADADATGKAELGFDATGKAETGVDAKAEVAPTISMHLDPGKVNSIPLVSMPINPEFKRASGGFTGAHLQINGCAGPVSVRSYAVISTVSPTSVDAVSVYGDARRVR